MTCYYGNLLTTVSESYQSGITKPESPTNQGLPKSFNFKLQALIETALPISDQQPLRKIVSYRHQAILATRQGQVITAKKMIEAAQKVLVSGNLSEPGQSLLNSFLKQAEAYLAYRYADYEEARGHITQALMIDMLLEDQYGYEVLHLHRIQLLHSLILIDVQCMFLDNAVQIASQLLNHLSGIAKLPEAPTLEDPNDPFEMFRLPTELRTSLQNQITSEVAVILIGKSRPMMRTLFASLGHYLQLEKAPQEDSHTSAHDWFLLKQDYMDNDLASFLNRASRFLAQGRAETPLLWYATAIDLLILSRNFNLPESTEVRQMILKDAIHWGYFPQKLLALVGYQRNTAGV